MSLKFLPNLFLLGAAKCGTTTLYKYLAEMPEVCMSEPKEPRFFESNEYYSGLSLYQEKYFSHWRNEQYIGDARHRNLFLPYIAEDIHKLNPETKLIIIVRNPVQRAYSHWWNFYSRRKIKDCFKDSIEKNEKRLKSGLKIRTRNEYHEQIGENRNEFDGKYMNAGTYIESGYYYEQIQRYRKFFPDNQIKVVLLEDLIDDPESVIMDLRHFLCLSSKDFQFKKLYQENKKVALRISNLTNIFSTTLKRVCPELIFERTKKTYTKLRRERPSLKEKERQWLICHYRSHNKELSQYLNRDLTFWEN